MSWEKDVDELRQREQLAYAMGGPDKVARQHEFNKLTIRAFSSNMSSRHLTLATLPSSG